MDEEGLPEVPAEEEAAARRSGAEPNVVEPQPTPDQDQVEPAPDDQPPVGPTLDLDRIISETLEIADYNHRKGQEQQLQNQKIIFMLTNIMDNLKGYEEHVDKVDTFLINNDIQQSEWYYKMCEQLPSYGDYSLLFNDSSDGRIQLEGMGAPVPEGELKKLVTETTDNYYAGGAHLRTQRVLCKSINEEIRARRMFLQDSTPQFAMWFVMANSVVRHYDVLRELIFKVTAYVNFLKTGELGEPLSLDVKKALHTP